MSVATPKQNILLSLLVALVAFIHTRSQYINCDDDGETDCDSNFETGRYLTWDEAPASRDEFDHNNDRRVCGIRRITVEQWEESRFWEGHRPVIVVNITDGWRALEHWTKEELLRKYPDVKVNMGDAKRVAQIGPDDASKLLSPTTINDFIANHMHNNVSDKYVFDRQLSIPKEMLDDCRPFPMPTRAYGEDDDERYKSRSKPSMMWKDHLAITIGSDQQGLTFHRHNAAWNVVIFGSKRWILYDAERIEHNNTRLKRMTRDVDNPVQLTSPNWIRTLYPVKERVDEIRNHGADCVQRAGELLFVPKGWAHMVLNIGDTVAIVSERGLEK